MFRKKHPGCFLYRVIRGNSADRLSDVLIQPPLRRLAIVRPIFIHGRDSIFLDFQERSHMTGKASIPGAHICHCDDQVTKAFHPFHRSFPIPWVFAVGDQKFINRETLIGAMPSHAGILVKILSDFFCILVQYSFPKGIYIHAVSPPACSDIAQIIFRSPPFCPAGYPGCREDRAGSFRRRLPTCGGKSCGGVLRCA